MALMGTAYKETDHNEQLPEEGHQTVHCTTSSYVLHQTMNVTALTHTKNNGTIGQ